VKPYGADIEIAPPAVDRERDAAVDYECENRDPKHQARAYLNGAPEAGDRATDHEERCKGQNRCIRKCGENAGAMVAEGFLRCRRT